MAGDGNHGRAILVASVALCISCLGAWIQSHREAVAAQNENAPASKIDPKAKELLDRALRALGGPAFLSFKTMTSTGRIYAIEEGATAGLAPFESAVEYPDKRRFSYGKKKPVVLINNGDQAWEIDKYGLTQQVPEQVRRWKVSNHYSLENLMRLRIHEPGVLIQAGGVDFVDNVPTQVIDIVEPRGQEVKLHLNRQNDMPVRLDYRVQDPQTQEWDDYADVYADYQKFQEIQTPMHITRFRNGDRYSETFRHTVRYDEKYPPEYFQPSG